MAPGGATTRTADIAVVGGGAIGCAIALELAEAGRSVIVVERGQPGAEASSAAAGMLAPQSESHGEGPFLDLALASLALFEPLVERLEALTGTDVEFRKSGMLRVVLDEGELPALRRALEAQRLRGVESRWLDAAEARRLEPALGPDVLGAFHLPHDYQVDNARLASALAQAAAARGVEFLTGRPVTAFRRHGGRVVGVEAGGLAVSAAVTVLAAGAWSGTLAATLGLSLPVGPAKGQIVEANVTPARLRLLVSSPAVYLVPRGGGRVLIGATVEHVGFDKRVTLDAIVGLGQAAMAICPMLRAAGVERSWAGLRPHSPDGLPILGEAPGLPGLVLATGHFRNGILLTPITARLIAELILSGRPSRSLDPFSAARFAA